MQRRALLVLLAFPFAGHARADEAAIPAALQEYVARPESVFALEKLETASTAAGGVEGFLLNSQNWQGSVWKHALYIYTPNKMVAPSHSLLFITGGRTGGRPGERDKAMGFQLAQWAGSPVAVLHAVPNQPLLGGKVEDDLITETFLRYLATKDPTLPLLFPMVKSAVKAMDAVQQVAERDWKRPIKTFVVTGASKRGWTTWLTPVADKRVVGIAPIVIDAPNFSPQMKYQLATWGAYSEQINDYSSKGLIDVMEKHPEIPLWRWVDPYTYRKQLTLPKMIVNGTNDPYWVVDALNNYWDGLVGPKYVFYVPNAAHNLGDGRERALETVGLFSRRTALGKPMPKMSWTFAATATGTRLTVVSEVVPKAATGWLAQSPTKDFRGSHWAPAPLTAAAERYVFDVAKSPGLHQAMHATLTFDDEPPFSLSTQIKWE